METWWKVFVSWVPFIILLMVWFYFMKRMRTSRQGQLVVRMPQTAQAMELRS
jgi:ATP-dependent Zn protease